MGRAAAALLATVPCGSGAAGCRSRFEIPPQGARAVTHNGVQLPDVCINATGQGVHHRSGHVFIIGDWGGVLSGKPGSGPTPADRRKRGVAVDSGPAREFVVGVDDVAQQKVAAQMSRRAALFEPDYVLNVGDNFYWGGVKATCGQTRGSPDNFSENQWAEIFEDMYTGPGLDGKQWLGVLGNHDYGGFVYSAGWDQTIMYSWKELPYGRPQRWVTPAIYWRSGVHYPEFSVDYFFVDSNHVEAKDKFTTMNDNLCSFAHNKKSAKRGISCAAEGGPESVDDCQHWFESLWKAQRVWLKEGLATSTADWQVVVTHVPPTSSTEDWKELAEQYGIDLMVTGHEHSQFVSKADDAANVIAPTVWVISGGGGGITSDATPSQDGGQDDQYGFMHLTLSKEELRIVSIDHNGHEGQRAVVQRRPCLRCHTTTGAAAARSTTTRAATTRSTTTEAATAHSTTRAATAHSTTTEAASLATAAPADDARAPGAPAAADDEGCGLRGGLSLRSPGTREQVERASAAALALALGVARAELTVTASKETSTGRRLAPAALGLRASEWRVGYAYHAGGRAADSVYRAAVAMGRNQTVLSDALVVSFRDLGLSFDRNTLAVSVPSKAAGAEADLGTGGGRLDTVAPSAAGHGANWLHKFAAVLFSAAWVLAALLAALLLAGAAGWLVWGSCSLEQRPLGSESAKTPGQDASSTLLVRHMPVEAEAEEAARPAGKAARPAGKAAEAARPAGKAREVVPPRRSRGPPGKPAEGAARPAAPGRPEGRQGGPPSSPRGPPCPDAGGRGGPPCPPVAEEAKGPAVPACTPRKPRGPPRRGGSPTGPAEEAEMSLLSAPKLGAPRGAAAA